MSSVEIEYCVPCGFRERAIGLAGAILAESETDLDELALVMGDHGVLQVCVDGETVYDKELEPFDESVIVAAVDDAL
jgi:selenoprotein W-related protein